MRKSKLSILLILLFLAGNVLAQINQTKEGDAILGEWINAEKDAKFQIYKEAGQYFGKIIWGTGGETKDVKNPDLSLRKRDLVGLVILNNFIFEGSNSWKDGTIYNPKDGKTYSCKLTLKSPKTLEVRGFVGISMFGKSETWSKIN
ncbi:DUF2147 domain-containing protein [Algoriphagus sp.]|uniref:DUF2147 domain-containing protein n=1 Tax=Algoriphagus sp. TaxID=1872435 RepID=UPI00391C94C1